MVRLAGSGRGLVLADELLDVGLGEISPPADADRDQSPAARASFDPAINCRKVGTAAREPVSGFAQREVFFAVVAHFHLRDMPGAATDRRWARTTDRR